MSDLVPTDLVPTDLAADDPNFLASAHSWDDYNSEIGGKVQQLEWSGSIFEEPREQAGMLIQPPDFYSRSQLKLL